MKTFLLFVALICATTTAATTATPNGNGEPLSVFLTNLKQALQNLLAMVQGFENEESTTTTTTTTTDTTTTTEPKSKYFINLGLTLTPATVGGLHIFFIISTVSLYIFKII